MFRRLMAGLAVASAAGFVLISPSSATTSTAGSPDPTFNGGQPLVLDDPGTALSAGVVELADGTTVTGLTRGHRFELDYVTTQGTLTDAVDPGLPDDTYLQLEIDSAGRIVASGYVYELDGNGNATSIPLVVRFDADGNLDESFADGGAVLPEQWVASIAPDGAYLDVLTVDPNGHPQVDRYDDAGALVTTFGQNGSWVYPSTADTHDPAHNETPHNLVVDAAHRIVVSFGLGSLGGTLARLTPTGVLDTTFGTGGYAATGHAGPDFVAAQGNAIVDMSGTNPDWPGWATGWRVTRFTPDGTVDSAFGDHGVTTTTVNSGVGNIGVPTIDPSGRILTAADANDGGDLARYLPDGAIDPSFGNGGIATLASGDIRITQRIAVDADAITASIVTWRPAPPSGMNVSVGRYLAEPTTDPATTTTSSTPTTAPPPPAPSSGGGGSASSGTGGGPGRFASNPTTTTTTPRGSSPDTAFGPGGDTTGRSTTADNRFGYWLAEANGVIHAFGDAAPIAPAGQAVVAIQSTPTGNGCWIIDGYGHVNAAGDAVDAGGAPALGPFETVVSMSPTPSGQGYWLFTSRGRALPYGDARSFGDLAGMRLNAPIIDSAATPDGGGYYLVGADGGVFTFGDAVFRGSTGNLRLNQPVRALVPTPTSGGYWLVASDGGVFTFGDATFRGSMGSTRLNAPIVGMVPYGAGYLMVGADGGVFDFSDRPFNGSLGANPPSAPIVSITALP